MLKIAGKWKSISEKRREKIRYYINEQHVLDNSENIDSHPELTARAVDHIGNVISFMAYASTVKADLLIMEWTPDGTMVYLNEMTHAVFGDVIGNSVQNVISEDDFTIIKGRIGLLTPAKPIMWHYHVIEDNTVRIMTEAVFDGDTVVLLKSVGWLTDMAPLVVFTPPPKNTSI